MEFSKKNKLDHWLKEIKKRNAIKYTAIDILIKIKLTLINLKNGRF